MTRYERKSAPGPPGYPVVGILPKLLPDPARFCLDAARTYGDVVCLDLGFTRAYLVSHPAGIQDVLLDNMANFGKGEVWRPIRGLLGNGLSGSEGALWQQQRRLLLPQFQHERLDALVAGMSAVVADRLSAWQSLAGTGQPVEVAAEMMTLTTRLMVQAVFGARLARTEADRLTRTITEVMGYIFDVRMPAYFLPGRLLTLRERRCRAGLAELDAVIYSLIEQGQPADIPGTDLLSVLAACIDEATGAPMPARQLRDEVVTLFLGAYQTTPTALAWTWALLAGHPAVESCLRAELDAVLGERPPALADLARLTYSRQVLEETMRLYPPVWMFPRAALAAAEIGGYQIPAGAMIWLSPYVTHRRLDLWPRPEEFDPERFRPEQTEGRPVFAYLPFGAGPRRCLGANLAMLQAQLILAGVARQYRLHLAPGQVVQPAARTGLRPRRGVWMTVERFRA